MNLAHQFKQLFIILSISLLGTTQVMANSLKIDIVGCLSVISSGSECGNNPLTGVSNTIFASGTFAFWDSLDVASPGTLASLPESKYFASTEVKAKPEGTPDFTFTDNKSKIFDSKDDLTNDPDWVPALTVFQAVVSGGTLDNKAGIIIDFSVANLSTIGNQTTGEFSAWSTSAINKLNTLSTTLFGRDLPNAGQPVDFEASAQLAAVPEPISLTLLGLGIAAMVSVRRKHA